ncbi:MAG: hypothetical protein WCP56_03475 [Candidatus Saccharibacteria bacterium]
MKKLLATSLIILGLLTPLSAKAQEIIKSDQIPVELQGPTVSELIANVLTILFFVAGAASVIVIVVAGIIFAVSAGDEKKIKMAKDSLLYAVIGLVISMSAYAITSFITGRLGA